MEIRQLRQFVVLAEELHFGNAAKRLNMAQPPLSQSIKRLETALGFDLFERSSRKVELTDAGRVFVEEVRKALLQLDYGARLGQRVHDGEIAQLNVGFVSTALFEALPRAIATFREVANGINLRLEERASQPQITGLLEGHLDIGFLHPPAQKLEELNWLSIERSRAVAAIPSDWPLAERRTIRFADLAALPLITLPYSHSPAHHMAILAACQQAGFTPQVAQEASQTQTMISLVAAGLGAAFTSQSAGRTGHAGVRFVPIEDAPPSLDLEIVAAWSPRRETQALRRFLSVLRAPAG